MIKNISDKRKKKLKDAGEKLAWNSTIKVSTSKLKRSTIKKISDKANKLWNEIRNKALERDNYACQKCGKTNKETTIDVHHKLHRSTRPDLKYDLDNLICLCRNCHAKEHT